MARLQALSAVNKDALAESLNAHGIRYEHFPELGGKRKSSQLRTTLRGATRRSAGMPITWRRSNSKKESANARLRKERRLGQPPNERDSWEAATPCATAIMCAEAVWWRCHRSLIADYLKARGMEVLHVLGANKVEPHPYASAAWIVNGE